MLPAPSNKIKVVKQPEVVPTVPKDLFRYWCKQKFFRSRPDQWMIFKDEHFAGCSNCATLIQEVGKYCHCGLVFLSTGSDMKVDHQEHIRRGMRIYPASMERALKAENGVL